MRRCLLSVGILFLLLGAVCNADTTASQEESQGSASVLSNNNESSISNTDFCVVKDEKYYCGASLLVVDRGGNVKQVNDVLVSNISFGGGYVPSLWEVMTKWKYQHFVYFNGKGALTFDSPYKTNLDALLVCPYKNGFLFVKNRKAKYSLSKTAFEGKVLHDFFSEEWEVGIGDGTGEFYVIPKELDSYYKIGDVSVKVNGETKNCSLYVDKVPSAKNVSLVPVFTDPVTGEETNCREYILDPSLNYLTSSFNYFSDATVSFPLLSDKIVEDVEVDDQNNGKVHLEVPNKEITLKHQKVYLSYGYSGSSCYSDFYYPYLTLKSYVNSEWCGIFSASYGNCYYGRYYLSVHLSKKMPKFYVRNVLSLNLKDGFYLQKVLEVNNSIVRRENLLNLAQLNSSISSVYSLLEKAKNKCPACSEFYVLFLKNDDSGKETASIFGENGELLETTTVQQVIPQVRKLSSYLKEELK